MLDQKIRDEYNRWMKKAAADTDLQSQLKEMQSDEAGIADAFYRNLAFGTGGLRGVIDVGPNRMNVYTVAKASQGLADYVRKHFDRAYRKIAVSYDSRIKSDLFAQTAAGVFAENEIDVWMYPELMPTPCLSFAVRELCCAAGIMVTASHNAAEYNGYKVYGSDGCQITTEAAKEIQAEIDKLDIFSDVKMGDFQTFIRNGTIQYIPEDIYGAFLSHVKNQTMLRPGEVINRDVTIVYSPLNGTGLKPVTRVLRESGYGNVIVVPEQEKPDGHFPTCPYPNPETAEALALGVACAESHHADLVLATDPDCDRVGIAVRNDQGEYVRLSGNETGVLLLDYICTKRLENKTMPADPVMIKTIVTTDMGEQVAASYGVRTVNVLTGFKFIGEQIAVLEKQGLADSYIFGFEESYGYLSGSYVRDKDAVDGAFLICEMFAYYKTKNISLLEKMDELYRRFGYRQNTLHSYAFEGAEGFLKMQEIMRRFRESQAEFGERQVVSCLDYAQGLDGLPKSDVLKFCLEGDCSVVVRPSGTEPKLKIYLSVCASDKTQAQQTESEIMACIEKNLRK